MIGITKEESGGPCLTKFRRRIGHSLNLEAILLCRCRYVSMIPKVCWQNDFPVSRWYLTACLTRSLGGSKPFTMGAAFLKAFFLAESIPSNIKYRPSRGQEDPASYPNDLFIELGKCSRS